MRLVEILPMKSFVKLISHIFYKLTFDYVQEIRLCSFLDAGVDCSFVVVPFEEEEACLTFGCEEVEPSLESRRMSQHDFLDKTVVEYHKLSLEASL